jgi:FtsZ-binding cell division protein ZapB
VTTFLGVTSERIDLQENNEYTANNNLLNYDNKDNTSIIESMKAMFGAQENVKENVFAKNSGLNIFVSNIIDDKQDLIDNLSKVIDEKFETIDGKLYKIDELIEKFAQCKTENEKLKTKVNKLRDENYILKDELGRFNKLILGLFLKK